MLVSNFKNIFMASSSMASMLPGFLSFTYGAHGALLHSAFRSIEQCRDDLPGILTEALNTAKDNYRSGTDKEQESKRRGA